MSIEGKIQSEICYEADVFIDSCQNFNDQASALATSNSSEQKPHRKIRQLITLELALKGNAALSNLIISITS